MEDKHVVQIKNIPLSVEEVQAAHSAVDVGHMWKEPITVVAEWGTVSPELQEDTSKLAEYVFNTKLPIKILGIPDSLEKSYCTKLLDLIFTTF